MKVGNIDLPRGGIYRGVYKIIIDSKWFYIGSSTDLIKRIGKWRSYLTRKANLHNKNISKVLSDQSVIEFKLIKRCKNTEPVKCHEDKYIKKWFNNPNCLNRCPSAFSTKGVRAPMGVIWKPRPISKGGKYPAPIAVARFDMKGNYIDQTRTMTDMAALLGCPNPSDFTTRIGYVARGKSISYKGYKFKFINSDGTFADPTQKGPRQYKKVFQIDSTGKIVNKFNGISEAVKITGAKRSSICKILYKKDFRKTTGGFSYAYEK